jgi:D-alanyl-D-alanine carboxypeptidase
MIGRSALRKTVGDQMADRPATSGRAILLCGILAGLAALVFAMQPAEARRHPWAAATSGYSTLVIDAESGQLLEADNPDAPHVPASLTKMMTAYLAFEALQQGKLRLTQSIPVSSIAAEQDPTKLDLAPGQTITVEQAMLGLTVRSANDAAVVLAEAMGGTESQFAEMMTRKARLLGMKGTIFRNASGLPDPIQTTTARDMATLARALIRDYPQYYHFFSVREFNFEGTVIPTHNHVLDRFEGADGLKTGFTNAAGWNIVISAVRNGRRLIGVVLGGHTASARDREVMQLLTVAFASHDQLHIASYRQPAAPSPAAQAPAAAAPTLQVSALHTTVPQTAIPQPALVPPPVPQAAVQAPPGETPALRQAMDQLELRSDSDVPSKRGAAAAREAQEWAVQIGAYGRYSLAHETALRAAHSTPALATY